MMGEDCERRQTHVHEFLGSTFITEEKNEEPHNHRFAGVSGEVIPYGDSHVHEICTNTDFYEEHLHEVGIRTGPAIYVAPKKHVHFAYGKTTVDDKHCHKFIFATLIEDPIVWHYCPHKDDKYD